jgi:hypothetical protein
MNGILQRMALMECPNSKEFKNISGDASGVDIVRSGYLLVFSPKHFPHFQTSSKIESIQPTIACCCCSAAVLLTGTAGGVASSPVSSASQQRKKNEAKIPQLSFPILRATLNWKNC